jgi:membrane protein required for colicin V production
MDMVLVTNIALVGILLVGGAIGFAKGFLEQALELLGVIVSFVVAALLGGLLAGFAADRFSVAYPPALAVVSIVLFFAGLMVTHLIARAIGRVVKMTLLGWVDRLAGALLGLLVAMILSSLLITLTLELPFPKDFQRDVQRSSVSLFLKPIAGQIFDFLVAHGPRAVHFEDIFKEGDTI